MNLLYPNWQGSSLRNFHVLHILYTGECLRHLFWNYIDFFIIFKSWPLCGLIQYRRLTSLLCLLSTTAMYILQLSFKNKTLKYGETMVFFLAGCRRSPALRFLGEEMSYSYSLCCSDCEWVLLMGTSVFTKILNFLFSGYLWQLGTACRSHFRIMFSIPWNRIHRITHGLMVLN